MTNNKTVFRNRVDLIVRSVLAALGIIDIFRGVAHTFAIHWAANTVAQMEPHPDALFLMGVFGSSNLLTGGLFLLIAWKAPQIAGWVLGLVPAAYVIGILGLQYNDVTAQSPFNAKYMMGLYFALCLVVFAFFLYSRRRPIQSRGLSRTSSILVVAITVTALFGCSSSGISPARQGADWTLQVSGEVPACVQNPGNDVPVLRTSGGIDFVRTPEERFSDLPDYPFAPNYAMLDGLRMHYVDQGPKDGEVILLLHGQPSWSYLYRKMIPPLAEAGFRVIAPDLMGLGKSDKPIDLAIHTYEQHVLWIKGFIEELRLERITLFAQDWGGLIGLRVAGDQPDHFARIVIANSTLMVIPQGKNPLRVPELVEIDCELAGESPFDAETAASNIRDRVPDFIYPVLRVKAFQRWSTYALTAPDFEPSSIVELATNNTLTPAEAAAYDAPYPTLVHKAAIRTLPSMAAAIEQQSAPAWEELGKFDRPFLFLAGKQDPNLGSTENQKKLTDHIPGAQGQPHERFEAHHFIQEDIGPTLADRVIRFMRANPLER
jgi:pimeloyl-ACP methyl ester carboxylesterase